jgi:cell division protein FtsB
MRSVRPTYRHVFVVVAVIVSLYFAIRTSNAVLVNQALARQLDSAQAVVATTKQQNAALSAELAYEQTPAYAEQMAREQLGMMKPGDHVVHVQVTAPPSGARPPQTPSQAPVVAPAKAVAVPTWRRWLLLLTHPATAHAAPVDGRA